MTSGACGNADARLVQVQKNVLPVNVFKRDVRGIWQPLRTIRRAVETRVGNLCEDLVFEAVAQPLDAFVIVVVACELASRTKTGDVWDRGRAGATTVFLRAADNERRQRQPFANIERADALRRVQFVT